MIIAGLFRLPSNNAFSQENLLQSLTRISSQVLHLKTSRRIRNINRVTTQWTLWWFSTKLTWKVICWQSTSSLVPTASKLHRKWSILEKVIRHRPTYVCFSRLVVFKWKLLSRNSSNLAAVLRRRKTSERMTQQTSDSGQKQASFRLFLGIIKIIRDWKFSTRDVYLHPYFQT